MDDHYQAYLAAASTAAAALKSLAENPACSHRLGALAENVVEVLERQLGPDALDEEGGFLVPRPEPPSQRAG